MVERMFGSGWVFEEMEGLLDEVLVDGFELGDCGDAVEAVRAVESLRRKITALGAQLQVELDGSQVFRGDGHVSAATMVRHVGRLSPSEAARPASVAPA